MAVDSRFVRVLDAMDGDQPFIVTEFATGITLRSLLAHGPVTALESAHIVRELADALAPMHAEGLFHRRLNPDTVVVTRTGNVKIMGFLLEAALAGATISSSDNWARQEAEDVRALGKILYACLVARWPIDPSLAQTSQWGLPAAPMSEPGPDGPHWAPPSSVDPRVPPTVNAICIQSFDPRPDSVPLRTADEIVIALGRVLGTAEADEVLGRRIRALPADEAGENAHIGLHAPASASSRSAPRLPTTTDRPPNAWPRHGPRRSELARRRRPQLALRGRRQLSTGHDRYRHAHPLTGAQAAAAAQQRRGRRRRWGRSRPSSPPCPSPKTAVPPPRPPRF